MQLKVSYFTMDLGLCCFNFVLSHVCVFLFLVKKKIWVYTKFEYFFFFSVSVMSKW
jgi:hypothetical protein